MVVEWLKQKAWRQEQSILQPGKNWMCLCKREEDVRALRDGRVGRALAVSEAFLLCLVSGGNHAGTGAELHNS